MKKTVSLLLIVILAFSCFAMTAGAQTGTATKVSFSKTTEMQATVGKNYRRTAVTVPEGMSVTYSSSDTTVATVDSNGRVRALKAGKATITARSGNATASYRITVVKAGENNAGSSSSQSGGGKTLEEIVNNMKLEPLTTDKWSKSYYTRIGKIAKDDMSNFEKLRAVYDDVIKNHDKNQNCVGYAVALQCAFEAVGFRTYHMRGEVTTTNGGWTEHSWVGIDIDGQLYYFDANLPGRYGSSADAYFALLPKNAKSYRNAFIVKLLINPDNTMYSILDAGEIPNTAAKRSAFSAEAGEKDELRPGNGLRA